MWEADSLSILSFATEERESASHIDELSVFSSCP